MRILDAREKSKILQQRILGTLTLLNVAGIHKSNNSNNFINVGKIKEVRHKELGDHLS